MIQKKFGRLVLAIFIALSAGTNGVAVACEDSDISLEMDRWKARVSGTAKAPGAAVNLKDDLGLDTKGVPVYRLNFKVSDNDKFFVNYDGVTFKAARNLPRSFSFDGGNYAAGDSVDSRLETHHYQVGLRNERVTAGGKVAILYSYTRGKIKTEMQDTTRNLGRTMKNTINCFNFGFGWESMNSKGINMFAEIMPLAIASPGGAYFEADAGVKTKLSEDMDLKLGYKYERLGDDKGNHQEVKLEGMYFSLYSKF